MATYETITESLASRITKKLVKQKLQFGGDPMRWKLPMTTSLNRPGHHFIAVALARTSSWRGDTGVNVQVRASRNHQHGLFIRSEVLSYDPYTQGFNLRRRPRWQVPYSYQLVGVGVGKQETTDGDPLIPAIRDAVEIQTTAAMLTQAIPNVYIARGAAPLGELEQIALDIQQVRNYITERTEYHLNRAADERRDAVGTGDYQRRLAKAATAELDGLRLLVKKLQKSWEVLNGTA